MAPYQTLIVFALVQPRVPLNALLPLQRSLVKKDTLLIAESGIVFVCGARQRASKDGSRDRLMQYAKKHIQGFEFFIAEDVFEALATSSDRFNLMAIERLLAEYSDCIIMLLETPSVFAELGAFSIDDRVVRKILVINDSQFEHDHSFINLGPLAKVERHSRFKPVLYTNLDSVLTEAGAVEKRLATVRRKNDQRIDLTTFAAFEAASPKHRILFLRDLIWLFWPLRLSDLVAILRQLYGNPKLSRAKIELHISLLRAIGLIGETTDHYLFPTRKLMLFFRYEDMDAIRLRAAVVNDYHKHDGERAQVMKAQVDAA